MRKREIRLPVAAWLMGAAVIAIAGCSSTGSPDNVDAKTAASIVGEWGLQIKQPDHTEEAVLHFSFEHGVLAGTYLGSDGTPRELEKISLSPDKISFDLEVDSNAIHAQGSVTGELMSGKMKTKPVRNDDSGSGTSGGSGGMGGGGRHGGGRGSRGRAPDGTSTQSREWTAVKRAASSPENPEKP